MKSKREPISEINGCHVVGYKPFGCLECPRAVCIHDEEEADRILQRREARIQQTTELLARLGDARMVAKALGIGRRAMERRLREVREHAA